MKKLKRNIKACLILTVFSLSLLSYGAETQSECEFEAQLLKMARVGNTDEVLMLLKMGADVNARDEDGKTALHNASQSGYTEIVRLLLDNGADVNAKDNYGRTALHNASESGYTEIVRLLLNNGADINAKDKWGQTALSVTGRVETGELLINMGIAFNLSDWLNLDSSWMSSN